MTRRIPTSDQTLKVIRDTGVTLPRVEANQVAAALSAEATAVKREGVLAPVTLVAVRQELVIRLQSSDQPQEGAGWG